MRRSAFFLLLSGALFLQATGARAENRIAFTKMTVEHCDKLIGTCTWKLRCDVGQPVPFDLVSGAKLGTAGSVAINQAFRSIPKFPTTVHCGLSVDDGWFSTSWKKVADGTLEIQSGGDYTLELAAKGEGKVEVGIAADSIELGPAATNPLPAKPGAAAGKRIWIGLYRAEEAGQAVVVGLDWPAFKAKVDQLAAKGVKVIRFKSYKDGDKIFWSGIFRTLPEEETVLADLEWEPFLAKWKDLTGHGKRLIDLETYDNGKKRLFAGIFREGNDPHSLWVGLNQQAFQRKWNELSASGLRLIDLNTYRSGKEQLFAGVFRSGVGTYGLWTGLTWDALTAKVQETHQNGTELAQIVTYMEGKERRYAAVVRSASSAREDLMRPLETAAFSVQWGDLAAKGWKLIDFATIPEE
ncbi:MAG TPA: hypothetical protein VMM92_05245 [Thermoanaerobaculia bacterium]|nr:hypothetical protein [Thermoanaerobaculia bacterium]